MLVQFSLLARNRNTTTKMNSIILLVLAVVAAQAAVIDPTGTIEYHYPDAAEIEASESPESRALARNNIQVGNPSGTWLLNRYLVSRPAVTNHVHIIDATYRTNGNIRLRAIQVLQVTSQGAFARIIAGGIGQTFVTIRIQSARSRGFRYQFSFWGR